MGRVDAQRVNHLCANAVNSGLQVVAQLLGHDARSDGDAGQIGHLVGTDSQTVACVCASRSAQDKVESVFAIDSQARDFCAQLVAGNVASLAAIAVQTQTAQLCSCQLDGVPFENDRGLGGIATAKDGSGRRVDAEGRVDVFLESVELLDGLFLGWFITSYVDVYDGARGDVGGQQDGRELNLWCALV